jgi:hypothetical protein
MTTDRVLLEELRKDEALQAFRTLVKEVIPQDLDVLNRASQVRLQARARAQEYLAWLRQGEARKEVCR